MKRTMLIILALVLMTGAATADVLWDQSNYDPNYGGFWDSESGCSLDWTGQTFFTACDIELGVSSTINSITTYYDMLEFGIAGATQAYLYITPKLGALPVYPSDDPLTQGTLVPITVGDDTGSGGNAWVVNASGLNVSLTPGEYWVVLTPIFPNGFWGPSFHIRSQDNWGDDSPWIEYCGYDAPAWVNGNPGNDASILIEGTVDVVAVEGETWGGLKALYR